MGDTTSGPLSTVEVMPWLETSAVKQRKQFVEAVTRREYTVSELCRRFGISRKTGYKWLGRFRDEDGDEGVDVALQDHPRRPKRTPRKIAPELEAAIVDARKRRPHWGPKKLRAVLAQAHPHVALPSESTFAAVFKRNGLVKPRRRRTKTTPYTAPLAHATRPNALWSIDFKGDFALGRTRCYPLTVTDAYSRYVIACVAMTNTRGTPVRRALERIFDEHGLPDAIRSDNGSPFAAKGVAGLSRLSVWWHKLGIRHERIDPGHPEQNGRHERMHFDLERVIRENVITKLAVAQRLFDAVRYEFNFERPHEALAQRTPYDHYEVSKRRLPEPTWGRDFEYGPDVEVVQISKLGYATCHRGAFFLSTTLVHEKIGLDWLDNHRARVRFGALLLGELRAGRRRRGVAFTAVDAVSPMSPDNLSPMSPDNAHA